MGLESESTEQATKHLPWKAKGKGGKPGRGKPPVSLAATPTSPKTVVNENAVAAPLLTKTPAS